MLELITPSDVYSHETFGDDVEGELLGSEVSAMSGAVPSRIAEFKLGRNSARRALGLLGAPQVAIPVANSRAPVWPDNVVGSITHCDGYCAAAVGSALKYKSIGIDASLNQPLPTEILDQVISAEERHHQAQLAVELSQPGPPAVDSLIFSIKEAVFKTWSPVTGLWLGFEDAQVTVDHKGSTFTAELNHELSFFPDLLQGRFTYNNSFIVAAIFLKL